MKLVCLLCIVFCVCLIASAVLAEEADPPVFKPHHGLPLLWDKIPIDQRGDFPSPYGLSVHYYHQKQTLGFASADIVAGGMPIPPTMAQVNSIDESSNAVVTRFDAWVLPFLNAYVHTSSFSGSVSGINVQSSLPLVIPDRVSYDGTNYGIGMVGAYGSRHYFFTYDWDWTWTRQDMVVGKGLTRDQGVRFGKRTKSWTVYTGAAKQSISGNRTGSTVLSDGTPISFDVQVRPVQSWTWLAGVESSASNNWDLILEMSFSNRKSTMLQAGRRF
jgi:hypothetical protein